MPSCVKAAAGPGNESWAPTDRVEGVTGKLGKEETKEKKSYSLVTDLLSHCTLYGDVFFYSPGEFPKLSLPRR